MTGVRAASRVLYNQHAYIFRSSQWRSTPLLCVWAAACRLQAETRPLLECELP